MIKTVKKFSKKSLAILIALLMIISVMPFTPPISVEAADDISFTGYTAANPTPLFSGSQSTETNMKKLKGTFWDNILWTSSTGSQAAVNPTITGTDGSQVATFYAKNTVLLLDGKTVPKMPVMYGNRTYYWFNGNATTATVYPTAGTDSTEDNTEIYLINKNNTDSSLDWKGGSGAKSQDFYYCRDSLSTYIGSSASNPNNRKGNNFTDGWTNRDWAHYASALMVDDSTINFNGAYSKKFNLTWHVKVVSSKRNTGPWEANITATNHNIYVVNYKPVLTLLGQIPTSTEYTNISNNNNYYTPATQTRYMNAVKALAGLNPNTYFTGKTDDTVGQAVSDCEKAIKDAITEYNQAKEALVHEHSYTSQVTTQPTCTTAGVTTYTCACGHSYTDDTTPAATGHTNGEPVRENVQDSTCTATGSYDEVVYCSVCNTEISRTEKTIAKKAHTWGDWVYDANKQEKRFCTVCNTVDSEKRNCAYIVKSETPATCIAEGKRVYRCTQCGNEYDEILPVNLEAHNTATREETTNATCTVAGKKETVTYCTLCNKEISRVKTEDIPVLAHNYGEPVYNAETNSDVFTCKNCGYTYSKTVAKMEELNAAIDELEALVNADDAAYKYEASALVAAKEAVANAKAYAEKKENRYKEQGLVDAETKKVLSAETNLKNGLAEYTVKFELYNYDDGIQIGDTVSVTKKYGEVAEKSYTFDKTEEGFPEYVVSKWTKKVLNDKGDQVETVLNSTANDMSVVVKENATYTCYVLKFKASTEGENATTRVRYLDKSGKTLKIDYATVGKTYTPNYSKVPKIPYYRFTEWKRVYGEDTPVGTRELVYQAQYEYDEVEANNCTIVGRGGISVNGSSQCTSRYDDKVILTGADKYAFCDENGNIISYINADYIYTPHINGTVYITKVETASTKASTAVTGYFKQLNTGTTTGGTPINTLYVNAQYYLPEGATAVEAGIVISSQQKETETLVIGGAGVLKVISDTQGANHEYSIGMTYTKTGTLYTRSYLICKLSDGTTKTVYSDDVTVVKL